MNKKRKTSYAQEVASNLFKDFMEQEKEDIQDDLKAVSGFNRMEKYLYYINRLELPMLAYIWGILPYDEARELVDVKMLMEHQHIGDIIEKFRFQEMDVEASYFYEKLKADADEGIFGDQTLDYLDNLPLSAEDWQLCEMTYETFFQQVLNENGYGHEMYYDILKRFKPEYLSFLYIFRDVVNLYIERKFNVLNADVLLEVGHPSEEKPIKKEDVLAQLEMVSGILSYCEIEHIQTPHLSKCHHLWQRCFGEVFNQILETSQDLPQHNLFPAVKRKITEMHQAFKGYFPKEKEENFQILREALFDTTYEVLKNSLKNKENQSRFLAWFEVKTADFYSIKKTKEKQENITRVSEKAIEKNIKDWKEKYLLDEEYFFPDAIRYLFSEIKDYDVLYLMGVLNEEERDLCEKKSMRLMQANKPCGVVDILNEQLEESSSEKVLPLKREYLTVMREIKLASHLYRELNLWNFSHQGDMHMQATDNLLEKEGFLLNDLVSFSQFIQCNRKDKRFQLSRELIDSYWDAVTQQLAQLPSYQGRPEVKKQIEQNMALFNTSKGLSKSMSWENKKKKYQLLIEEFKRDLDEKYQNNAVMHQEFSKVLEGMATAFNNLAQNRNSKILKKKAQQNIFSQKECER